MIEDDVVGPLLKERQAEYGSAWLLAGQVIAIVGQCEPYLWKRLIQSTFAASWVLIVVKLCRLLANPTKADTWMDIEGYARLVRTHIETGDKEDGIPSK